MWCCELMQTDAFGACRIRCVCACSSDQKIGVGAYRGDGEIFDSPGSWLVPNPGIQGDCGGFELDQQLIDRTYPCLAPLSNEEWSRSRSVHSIVERINVYLNLLDSLLGVPLENDACGLQRL